MKKKRNMIVVALMLIGIIFIGYKYKANEDEKTEYVEQLKTQYSNQNGAFFQKSAWTDYHNADLLEETKVWVGLYVYNKYVPVEEEVYLIDVQEYLSSEFNEDGSLRIEKGYEKVHNYVNWYEYSMDQGDSGRAIIEKYKDDLHFDVEWEYKKTENPDYEIKLIDELSIPQVKELIKKYEDPSYQINDDIMMGIVVE